MAYPRWRKLPGCYPAQWVLNIGVFRAEVFDGTSLGEGFTGEVRIAREVSEQHDARRRGQLYYRPPAIWHSQEYRNFHHKTARSAKISALCTIKNECRTVLLLTEDMRTNR